MGPLDLERGSMSGDLGKRNEWIVVHSGRAATDGEGNPVNKYGEKVMSGWARARSVSGREFESKKSISTEISWKFETNYRRDITRLMKIEWNGSMWNIHDIERMEDK